MTIILSIMFCLEHEPQGSINTTLNRGIGRGFARAPDVNPVTEELVPGVISRRYCR